MDLAGEVWKEIPGYGGWYEASNLGRIRSWRFGKSKARRSEPVVMTIDIDRGYGRVCVTPPGGRGQTRTVHQLVMEAFVGLRPAGMVVCHADGDRSNNQLENLRYGTYRDNQHDKINHGRSPRGTVHKMHILNDAEVIEIRSLYDSGTIRNMTEIGRRFGVTRHAVSHILNGTSWAWLT